jgi:hypothetical protein
MKKRRNNSARASTLQITLSVCLISISVILLASSFKGAQFTPQVLVSQNPDLQDLAYRPGAPSAPVGAVSRAQDFLLLPEVTCGADNIRAEATNSGNNAGYATLKAAFDAINAGTHTGTINIGVCGNTIEAASAVLNASGTGAASYTLVLITPTGARMVSGSLAAPIINLNGATNVTIDGLNTGGNSLTISNLSTSSASGTSTIRFINGAQNNLVQNSTVQGSSASASGNSGVIVFSTTTGLGNSNNTITGCNIGPAASNLPTVAISGNGTSGTPNANITISNNNIFDFFSAATDGPRGVLASTASDAWTISGNSFYQTASRTFTASVGTRVISIENASGNGFVITNNYIGGSAPSAGGAAWTQNGSTNTFIGIRVSDGTTTPTSIQGNVVRNISIDTSTTSSVNAGISAVTGSMNIGTATGNTIGSPSTTGSITWTGAGSGAQLCGILAGTGTPGAIAISNNNIGGITVAGAGTTTLYGIRLQGTVATSATVSNNTIGSTTTANSIQSNSNTSLAPISSTNTGQPITVTGNTIANIQHTSSGTNASFRGIEVTGNVNGHVISNNTVRDVSTASTNTNLASGNPAAVGIFANNASGRDISKNSIHNIASTDTAAAVGVIGIMTSTATSSGSMNANLIYNLSTASSSSSSTIKGIYLHHSGTSSWTMTNNMIRLGTDLSTAIDPIVHGIDEETASTATNDIWFNSVFVGGTQSGATVNTACILRNTTGTMDIRDDILWNSRNSTGAAGANAGRHYAIQCSMITGTFTSNRNDLLANGNGGAVGFFTADQITLG